MDALQLQSFIESMNKNQQMLIEKLINSSAEKNLNQQIPKISHVPTFENFDSEKENFVYYKQRFENYLTLKEIHQDKKKCALMLLNSIGASNYNLLAALVAPRTPDQLSYDELMNELEKHLAPKRSILVSQHYFLSNYQNENESIADYVASLKRGIADCEFKTKCECEKEVSAADVFLRAQFIRGIKEDWIKEQILQSELSKFNEIVSKAIALEASKADSKELSNRQSSNISINASNEVHKISSKAKPRRNQENLTNNQQSRSKSRNRIDFEKLDIENLCLRCGRDNHKSNNCRITPSTLKCTLCYKTGHVARVCIGSRLKSNSSNRAPIHQVNHYEEQLGINRIVDIYDQSTINSGDTKKFFASVKIENRHQKFEVDSGAGFTLIPESEYKSLRINNEIQKTDIAFRSYTENIFRPIGKVQVRVKYQQNTSKEDLYIVPNGFEPLLGRSWIRHLKINLEELEEGDQDSLNGSIKSINNAFEIEKSFPKIFEQKVGCVPDITIKLQLREGVKPSYTPEREVPYALRDPVEKELDYLETAGIITKATTSD